MFFKHTVCVLNLSSLSPRDLRAAVPDGVFVRQRRAVRSRQRRLHVHRRMEEHLL